MSDHEFEKQVQRKMDELKIRPSDAVWTEVQKNIRQIKRRRRFGFWLPVFFAFLATTGYVLYTHYQPSALPIAQSKKVTQTNTTSSNNNNLHTENNSTQTTNNTPVQKAQDEFEEPEQPNSIIIDINGNAAQQNSTPSHNNATPQSGSTPLHSNPVEQQNNTTLHTNDNNRSNHISLNHTRSTTRPQNNTTKNNRKPITQPSFDNTVASMDEPGGRHPNTTVAEEPENTLAATIPATASREDDPIATSKAAPNALKIFAPEKQNSTATATMPVPSIQKQKGPKWQWGVQASAGYSRISQTNLFNLNGLLGSPEKNRAEDLAMRSPAPPGYQQSTYISVAPPVEKKAAPIQADLAYSAGVFVQKPLSKRLRFTIGLQYTYMSAHTTIGKLVEKSTNVNYGAAMQRVVPSYYTVAETKDALQQSQLNTNTAPVDTAVSQKYTYRFHAIELPVMINWQINKGRRLPPFVLDAGFSLARMWSIDALHFDGIQGIYYKNNDLFNKTQLNALLGLNVGLFQRSKFPVWIGPSLRYSLTGLLKKEVSKGQFLWSTGIGVRVGLNRL